MPGSWFVDMESWEVDEGIWELDEGSLEGYEGRWGAGGRRTAWTELGAPGWRRAGRFRSVFYDRSGRWALYWIWDLGALGLGGDWREDLPPCFFGIWCPPERANRHAGGGPGGFPFSAKQTGTFLFGPAARFDNWACGRPLVASLYVELAIYTNWQEHIWTVPSKITSQSRYY
jgi:hypothetical protein